MENKKTEWTNSDLYEVHCTICGARLGFYAKGSQGNGIPCNKCKRNLSFIVQDGETIVRCKQEKA